LGGATSNNPPLTPTGSTWDSSRNSRIHTASHLRYGFFILALLQVAIFRVEGPHVGAVRQQPHRHRLRLRHRQQRMKKMILGHPIRQGMLLNPFLFGKFGEFWRMN
jgi:hypothetical protein